jgi:hypothetical protein
MHLVAGDQSSEVEEPSEEALYLPSAPVAAESAAVVASSSALVARRRKHSDVAFRGESFIEAIAVVGFIADENFRLRVDDARVERVLDERDFVGRRTLDRDCDGKTMSVGDGHDLRPFAFLRFADKKAPFFAPAKEPSMKHSLRSSLPRSQSSRPSATSIFANVPSSTHPWNLR